MILFIIFFSITNEYNITILIMKWKLILNDIKLSSTSNFFTILYYHLGYPFIIWINWQILHTSFSDNRLRGRILKNILRD